MTRSSSLYFPRFLCLFALASCGGPVEGGKSGADAATTRDVEARKTPEGTVQEFLGHCRRRDFDRMLGLLHPKELSDTIEEVRRGLGWSSELAAHAEKQLGKSRDELQQLPTREVLVMLYRKRVEAKPEDFEKLTAAAIDNTSVGDEYVKVMLKNGTWLRRLQLTKHEGTWWFDELPLW